VCSRHPSLTRSHCSVPPPLRLCWCCLRGVDLQSLPCQHHGCKYPRVHSVAIYLYCFSTLVCASHRLMHYLRQCLHLCGIVWGAGTSMYQCASFWLRVARAVWLRVSGLQCIQSTGKPVQAEHVGLLALVLRASSASMRKPSLAAGTCLVMGRA
jgi:hypothetical protein